MKKRTIVIAGIIVLAIACCGVYFSGILGISADEINQEQMETVSWDEQDYSVVGASDEENLYVGVMYKKDYSDAKYFIYIKKDGLSLGWHFLQSGNLTETDGVSAFDCGQYGTAYVALNANGTVQRMEREDGNEPSVSENVSEIICDQSQDTIRFYDASGNEIVYNTVTVLS